LLRVLSYYEGTPGEGVGTPWLFLVCVTEKSSKFFCMVGGYNSFEWFLNQKK
jgi:hypothetical protein